jgi:hypothetical protein
MTDNQDRWVGDVPHSWKGGYWGATCPFYADHGPMWVTKDELYVCSHRAHDGFWGNMPDLPGYAKLREQYPDGIVPVTKSYWRSSDLVRHYWPDDPAAGSQAIRQEVLSPDYESIDGLENPALEANS